MDYNTGSGFFFGSILNHVYIVRFIFSPGTRWCHPYSHAPNSYRENSEKLVKISANSNHNFLKENCPNENENIFLNYFHLYPIQWYLPQLISSYSFSTRTPQTLHVLKIRSFPQISPFSNTKN